MRHASMGISRWQIHCGPDAGSLVVRVSCFRMPERALLERTRPLPRRALGRSTNISRALRPLPMATVLPC